MGPYVIFLATLAVWTFFALRDEPQLRPYAVIYGVNTLVANAIEAFFSIRLDLYSFGGFAGFFLVTTGIEPLLGVLYAHYSDRWSVLRAIGAAAILGGPVEWLFLWSGAFRYDRGWHPFLSEVCFTAYFLWTRWLKKSIWGHSRSLRSLQPNK